MSVADAFADAQNLNRRVETETVTTTRTSLLFRIYGSPHLLAIWVDLRSLIGPPVPKWKMSGGTKSKDAAGQVNSQMAWLLLMSIFIASANTLLYKAALNAFSSPTTNYGFFANQFSILVYVFQALLFSIFILVRDPNSVKELWRIPQSVYLKMGFLDSASGTLGAIAG